MLSKKHDYNFDWNIVNAYTIDNEPHEDYDTVAAKINNEMFPLFHGTTFTNAAGILSGGVTIDDKGRTGRMFGNGFYLAKLPAKAMFYSSDSDGYSGDGILFVCKASLGKTKKSLLGTSDRCGEGSEWHEKFDTLHARTGPLLLNDEFIVKNPNQLKIKYVLWISKKPITD